MKNFSTWPEHFKLYFSETLNFADFKYVFKFFISYLASIKGYIPSK